MKQPRRGIFRAVRWALLGAGCAGTLWALTIVATFAYWDLIPSLADS